MSSYDELVKIEDGCLVLTGIANDGVTDEPIEYLTGGLSSQGKKGFGYGRLDVCAKMKDVQGSWPAIWLLPNDGTRWPTGGEIDIMERLNSDNFAYQTVHSEYTQYGPGDEFQPYGRTAPMNPGEFNVYTFEHYPDSLIFSINGVRSLKYLKDADATNFQWPFDREYYFVLSMQLNCDWCGETDKNDLPDEMLIDWIHFTAYDETK